MSRTLPRIASTVIAFVAVASCANNEPDVNVEGLAESEAVEDADTNTGVAESAASSPVDNSEAGQNTNPTAGGEVGGVTVTDSEVSATATDIVLTSATMEMNTQPDDEEWGLLQVSDAYATIEEGDLAAAEDTKLVVIEIELTMGQSGNVFDDAFRLRADDRWYSPVADLNQTAGVGQVINTAVVFEIPRSPTSLTLEGGLPESLGVGRRASYDITLTPGPRSVPDISNDDVERTASKIQLASSTAEMNTQPDDEEWALLAIPSAYSTVIDGDHTATTTTKLVIIEIELTIGQSGNVFDDAFRLQADGEWYSPINDINKTGKVGEIINDQLVFEIPRPPTSLTLEGGIPNALTTYDWPHDLRTTTYELTL